jgi:hypothetical protein
MSKKKNTVKMHHTHVPDEKIALRAYEKWCKRGRPTATDDKHDWLEAERELRAEMAAEREKRVGSSSERGSSRASPSSVSRTTDPDVFFESWLRNLDSEEETVREEAIARLSFFGEESFFAEEALPRVINALNDNSGKVRAIARRLFFPTYRNFRLPPKLRKALESVRSEVRLEAIQEIVNLLPDAKKAIAAGWRGWESFALLTTAHRQEEIVGPRRTRNDESSEDTERRHTAKEGPMHRPRKKSAGRGLSQRSPRTVKAEAELPGGIPAANPSGQLETNHGPVQWKPWLDSYQDLRALTFPSREQFAAAAELLWTGQLRDLPYDLVGNHTIIVPAEAVAFFRGLEVTETDVLHPSDMAPQELADLRKEQGPY